MVFFRKPSAADGFKLSKSETVAQKQQLLNEVINQKEGQ